MVSTPIARLFAVLTAFAVAGCSLLLPTPELPTPPPVKGGDRLLVVEDSLMQQTQGGTLGKLDHRALLQGWRGAVVQAGAVVVAAGHDDPMAIATGAGTSHAHHNPWIYVRIVSSPVPAQVGWAGWVHHTTTAPEASARPHAPPPADHLERASRVCPQSASFDEACVESVPASSTVRILGCAGPRVWIEHWDDAGMYVAGYVGRTQFGGDLCRP